MTSFINNCPCIILHPASHCPALPYIGLGSSDLTKVIEAIEPSPRTAYSL